MYEIWMKYESGRESFMYNDGKVSGMSNWSRFGTYVTIYNLTRKSAAGREGYDAFQLALVHHIACLLNWQVIGIAIFSF